MMTGESANSPSADRAAAASARPAVDSSEVLLDPGGKVDQESLFKLYEQMDGDDDRPVKIRLTLSRDLNKRLDRYLVDRIPFLSRTAIQNLIRENAVTVNGRVPKVSTRLRKDDEIVAVLPPPSSTELPAEEIPLDILFEDEHLIVINKPDDIIVHPARGNKSGTIINGLAWHFQNRSGGALSTVGEEFARPGVVHRLDRHTSGVMVAAKSDTAHWRLGKQFEQRRVEKRYLAVVHGRMETLADSVDFPLGKHPTEREKYAVRWDSTGKQSLTIYRVRETYDDFSLVELELKTGRTHQIRIHLSHIGYPIAADDMYGGRHLFCGDVAGPAGHGERSPREPVQTRQALHAALLSFTHPTTEQRMTFQAPLHADMRVLIEMLRRFQNVKTTTVPGATIDLEQMMAGGAAL